MVEFVIKCSVRLEGMGDAESGNLVLNLPLSMKCGAGIGTAARRIARAAQWVLDLDAQYRDLVREGRSPQITVFETRRSVAGRVERETPADYRRLQLGIGELVRPLLLDPPYLKELYPFQRQGVEWLSGRSGGILADDMGLGKTVQVIAAVRLLFNRAQLRSVLVVCPKSLIATWEREFERWAPELGVAVLTPPAQIREDAWKAVVGRCHVLLTNYEQLRDPPCIFEKNSSRPDSCR